MSMLFLAQEKFRFRHALRMWRNQEQAYRGKEYVFLVRDRNDAAGICPGGRNGKETQYEIVEGFLH